MSILLLPRRPKRKDLQFNEVTGQVIAVKRKPFLIALYNYIFKTKDPCPICIVTAMCNKQHPNICHAKDKVNRFKRAFEIRCNSIKERWIQRLYNITMSVLDFIINITKMFGMILSLSLFVFFCGGCAIILFVCIQIILQNA